MGNAACQGADGLHSLGLCELGFKYVFGSNIPVDSKCSDNLSFFIF